MRPMMWILAAVVLSAGAVAGPLLLGGDDNVRPPAIFDHTAHVNELGVDSCQECHSVDSQGRLELVRERQLTRDEAHDACGQCHVQRAAGPHPALCGACHPARTAQPAANELVAMESFDHDQHTDLLDDACERCHHVQNQATGRLAWSDGDEASCADCHEGDGLRRAAHQQCVGCHADGPTAGGAAPVRCQACHGPVPRS